MKLTIDSIYPYDNIEGRNIILNNWKIININNKSIFFIINIKQGENIIQAFMNIENNSNKELFDFLNFFTNQTIKDKYEIEKDFINTIDISKFYNLISFLREKKLRTNIIFNLIFPTKDIEENILMNLKNKSFDENNIDLFETIQKKYVEFINSLDINNFPEKEFKNLLNFYINRKILFTNKFKINEDIKNKLNLEEIDLVYNKKLNEENITLIEILASSLKIKQEFQLLIIKTFFQYETENIKEKKEILTYLNKIEKKDISLPVFLIDKEKNKDFYQFLQETTNTKEFKILEEKYNKENKQKETSLENILYFKYLSLKKLKEYISNFGIKLKDEDLLWIFFDKNFLDLSKKLNIKENIENIDKFKTNEILNFYKNLEGYKNIINKINKKININGHQFTINNYLDQYLYEFVILYFTGYVNYLLIVADYIKWTKDKELLVGPGRGSAVGSLLVFLLAITNVDPIPYDLMFERFLNPARISPPDIDIDFEDNYRASTLGYIQEKYGTNNVFKIGTFTSLGLKSAFIQSGIHFGLDPQKRLKIQNIIEDFKDDLLKDNLSNEELSDITDKIIESSNIFLSYDEEKDIIKKCLKYLNKLNGKVVNVGVHACGIIISPEEFNFTYNLEEEGEHLKLINKKDKGGEEIIIRDKETKKEKHIIKGTLIEGPDLEGTIGLLKFDFLGLSTLSLIKKTIKNINKYRGEKIKVLDFVDNITFNKIDDQETFRIFQEGFTTGVFQFESEGMKKFLKQLFPTNIEDIIAMNALYRPGPIGFIPVFIKRKWVNIINNLGEKDITNMDNLSTFVNVFEKEIIKGILYIKYRKFLDKILHKTEYDKEKNIIIEVLEKWKNEEEKGNIIYTNIKKFFIKSFENEEETSKKVIKIINEYNILEGFDKIEKIILSQTKEESDLIKLLKNDENQNTVKSIIKNIQSFYKVSFLNQSIKGEILKIYGKEILEEQEKKLEVLKNITKKTYGIFVYQEQLMLLSKILAGFTSNDADTLRKIIGKKKLDKIPALRKQFINGCLKNGIKEEISGFLFDNIIKPAGEYAFNKSHAAAYSIIAFITAYLKRHYFEEFIISLIDINLEKGSNEKDIERTKVFNSIKDISLANCIPFIDKKYKIKNYNLTTIQHNSSYLYKKEDNKIEIYLSPKVYKGISNNFLTNLESISEEKDNKIDFKTLIDKKIIRKNEFYSIILSLFIKYGDFETIFDYNKNIKEIFFKNVDMIYEKIEQTTKNIIKKYYIENFLLTNFFIDTERFNIFFEKYNKFQTKREKEFNNNSNQKKNVGLSLFEFSEDDNFKKENIEKQIIEDLLKEKKYNFIEDFEDYLYKINSFISSSHGEKVIDFIIQLIKKNIKNILLTNKIDYLLQDKIKILSKINNKKTEVKEKEEDIYIILDVKKIDRGANFFVKYLSTDLGKIKKEIFYKTKYNIELFDFYQKNIGNLFYFLDKNGRYKMNL